jgi:hypothetical protein
LALPSELEDCPALQCEQLVDCATSLILPTAHFEQECSPVSLPNSPGKHGKQNARRTSGLLLPFGHASHANPSALLLRPLPHWTQGNEALAELLVHPAGQLKQ